MNPSLLCNRIRQSLTIRHLIWPEVVLPAELEMLLLGGSSLDVPFRAPQVSTGPVLQANSNHSSPAIESHGSVQQALSRVQGDDAMESYRRRIVTAVVDAVHLLSSLKVLELTFFSAEVVTAVGLEIPSLQARAQIESFIADLQALMAHACISNGPIIFSCCSHLG